MTRHTSHNVRGDICIYCGANTNEAKIETQCFGRWADDGGLSAAREPKTVTLYRKKPKIVEAFKWQPDIETMDGKQPLPEWLVLGENCTLDGEDLLVQAPDGLRYVSPGDWVIKDTKGVYPCKPDIFEATYEPVGE